MPDDTGPTQIELSQTDGGASADDGATSCDPADPCATGVVAVVNGESTCVPTAKEPDGTECGNDMVCIAGACVSCVGDGDDCASDTPCRTGTLSCDTGVPVCVDSGNVDNGTPCGDGNVCFAGRCVACAAGARCITYAVCKYGVISCDTGRPVCGVGGDLPDQTECGFEKTCQSGQCI